MLKDQLYLSSILKKAEKKIRVGSTYYHYKNPDKFYVIENIGILEATEEICVCYRALYDKKIMWIRPVEIFLEKIKVEGRDVSRFVVLDTRLKSR